MAHKPIELILLRQLASRLPLPVTLVDADGSVVYINPANERLLNLTQDSVAEFPYDRLQELIEYRHADGSPMELEDRPLAVALHDRRPLQARSSSTAPTACPIGSRSPHFPSTVRGAPMSGPWRSSGKRDTDS